MSDKEWYKNIPEQGMLCKIEDKNSDFVEIVVIEKRHIAEFTQEEINGITPLTAYEWWKFAPWQDMDSAPRDGSWFCVIGSNTQRLTSVRFYASADMNRICFDKWLPLPQVQS